ncbi:MAG: hypothetical protein R3268_07480 [Acidiferrobacterales bacterium]|nr:hypothetical protein [Acidiferrobacterales bacterium]
MKLIHSHTREEIALSDLKLLHDSVPVVPYRMPERVGSILTPAASREHHEWADDASWTLWEALSSYEDDTLSIEKDDILRTVRKVPGDLGYEAEDGRAVFSLPVGNVIQVHRWRSDKDPEPLPGQVLATQHLSKEPSIVVAPGEHYQNCGTVLAVAEDVDDISPGDHIVWRRHPVRKADDLVILTSEDVEAILL